MVIVVHGSAGRSSASSWSVTSTTSSCSRQRSSSSCSARPTAWPRRALVPTVVNDDSELVNANSRLSLLSGVMGLAVGLPAAGIVKLLGPEAALVLAAIMSGTASALATRLAPAVVAPEPVDPVGAGRTAGTGHRARRRKRWDCCAASSAFSRSCSRSTSRAVAATPRCPSVWRSGRAAGESGNFPTVAGHPGTKPEWQFGVVLVASVAGALIGAAAAPRVRRMFSEERILIAVLIMTAVGAVACALQGGVLGAAGWRADSSASPRARDGWRSTRSCSATRPTRTSADRSRASRRASSCCG